MPKKTHQSLETLAERDPVSRPLALLYLEALHTATDPVWDELAGKHPIAPPVHDTPALYNQSISVDTQSVSQLLQRLAATFTESENVPALNGLTSLSKLDPLQLLQATIESNDVVILQLADELGVDPQLLAILGRCISLPPLLALGRRVIPDNEEVPWEPGYCPTCGNWPLLAEQRGLDKQQWLRCGRCATAWRTRQQRCVFCDNSDHTKLGYMAAEGEQESRRVAICHVCKGYLKVFATVRPYSIADLLRQDLESVELDIAAIDQDFERPDRPGYPLQVTIDPSERSPRGCFPWR